MTRFLVAILSAVLFAGAVSALQPNPLRDRLLRNDRSAELTGWYQRADTGEFFLFDRSGEAALLRERDAQDAEVLVLYPNRAPGGGTGFRTLLMTQDKTELVLSQTSVQGVALTGSVGAGMAVAKLAGSLLKKHVVELGGSDGYIIFEDADLPAAAASIVKARLLNSGQSCIGPKRLLVQKSVKQQFSELLVAELKPRHVDSRRHRRIPALARWRLQLRATHERRER